jgi:hypothetical protein
MIGRGALPRDPDAAPKPGKTSSTQLGAHYVRPALRFALGRRIVDLEDPAGDRRAAAPEGLASR